MEKKNVAQKIGPSFLFYILPTPSPVAIGQHKMAMWMCFCCLPEMAGKLSGWLISGTLRDGTARTAGGFFRDGR